MTSQTRFFIKGLLVFLIIFSAIMYYSDETLQENIKGRFGLATKDASQTVAENQAETTSDNNIYTSNTQPESSQLKTRNGKEMMTLSKLRSILMGASPKEVIEKLGQPNRYLAGWQRHHLIYLSTVIDDLDNSNTVKHLELLTAVNGDAIITIRAHEKGDIISLPVGHIQLP